MLLIGLCTANHTFAVSIELFITSNWVRFLRSCSLAVICRLLIHAFLPQVACDDVLTPVLFACGQNNSKCCRWICMQFLRIGRWWTREEVIKFWKVRINEPAAWPVTTLAEVCASCAVVCSHEVSKGVDWCEWSSYREISGRVMQLGKHWRHGSRGLQESIRSLLLLQPSDHLDVGYRLIRALSVHSQILGGGASANWNRLAVHPVKYGLTEWSVYPPLIHRDLLPVISCRPAPDCLPQWPETRLCAVSVLRHSHDKFKGALQRNMAHF